MYSGKYAAVHSETWRAQPSLITHLARKRSRIEYKRTLAFARHNGVDKGYLQITRSHGGVFIIPKELTWF